MVRAGGAVVSRRGVRRAAGGVPHRPRGRHAPRHRQRRARRAVRCGVAAAPSGDPPLLGAAARFAAGRRAGRHGAPLSPARPSGRLPAEDQLLRRLDRGRVGAVPPRARPVRRQRGRGDPAPVGRRSRLRPLSPAPDRHDGRRLRNRRPLRPRPVDLVSRLGRGLRGRGHRARRPGRVARGIRAPAAGRRGVHSRRRSGRDPGASVAGPGRASEALPQRAPSRGPDVDRAAGFSRRRRRPLLRRAGGRARLARRRDLRSLDPPHAGRVPCAGAGALSGAPLPRHHPLLVVPVPGARTGTWRWPPARGASRSTRGRATRRASWR